MAHRLPANITLYASLFALAAAMAVSTVSLATWNDEIAERLTLNTAVADDIPADAIIGGVNGAEAYEVTPPPMPIYRSPNERLPSQTPPEPPYEAYTYAYVDSGYAYQDAATASGDTDQLVKALLLEADDTTTSDGAQSAEALERQASILADMRRSSPPSEDLAVAPDASETLAQ